MHYNADKYNAINGSMTDDEGGVKLPFPAFLANVINGNPEKADLKAANDARYFGGWKFPADKNDSQITPENKLPDGFTLQDVWSKYKGEFYQSYLGRALYVAPIARRAGWFTNEKTGASKSAVQILCLTANKTDAVFVVCGAVILSAGSHAGIAIDQSFARFDQATRAQRRALGNIPANYFWRRVGTFGDVIGQTEKGKASKSPITPLYLQGDDKDCKTPLDKLTAKYTPEILGKLFVGEAVADTMLEMLGQAAEWRAEWKRSAGEHLLPATTVSALAASADPVTGEMPTAGLNMTYESSRQ